MSEERVPLSQADGAQTPQEPKKVTSETYKCPSCGNFLKFDPATQKLKCAYCGTERDIAAKPAQELVYTTLSEAAYEAWGGTKAYKCPSCGAVSVLEEYETADVCPFCGAPNIIERDELPGLKPNAVLPFKVPEDEAKGFWRKWLKKKWLAPRKLKKEARMQKMRGVYIPVWTFDSHVDAMYEARLGETYTVIVGTGKNRRTETRVRWFHVSGVINQDYDDIQVEASKHIDGKALGKLGGFDTVNALAYDDDWLFGGEIFRRARRLLGHRAGHHHRRPQGEGQGALSARGQGGLHQHQPRLFGHDLQICLRAPLDQQLPLPQKGLRLRGQRQDGQGIRQGAGVAGQGDAARLGDRGGGRGDSLSLRHIFDVKTLAPNAGLCYNDNNPHQKGMN